jgi:hypothetical protein
MDGLPLPTPHEIAAQEQQRANEAQQRADAAQQRADAAQQQADAAQQRAAELEALLARYRERFGDAPA